MYFLYLSKKYLKYFLIVFFSLSFLYTIVSMLFNISKLPSSSNLVILYIFYIFIYSAMLLYPLAIIFSFLLTLSHLIKFNELISFYSSGFTPKKIFKPFLIVGGLIVFFMFGLQSTKLAYTNEYAQAIKNAEKLNSKDLFLKYENKVIYIENLNPILKKAKNINVIQLKNNKVKKIIFAKEAVFRNNKWFAKNANIVLISNQKWIKQKNNLVFLKNFKPKILSNLQKLRDISLYDAYLTIKYFKNIDLNTILSIVFFKIFTPFSILALMFYIFIKAPIHIRLSNITFFMLKSISLSVLVWGGMLILYKFAKQGVLPFWSLSIIFIILLIFDIFIRRKNEFSRTSR